MKTLVIATVAALALVSCSNEETAQVNDSGVALQVRSGIESRAMNNTWEAGDAIGIYMLKAGQRVISENAENRKYSTEQGNSTFTAAEGQTIYFPIDDSTVDFEAYYPYTDALANGNITLDVSNQGNLPAIDLMTAESKSAVAAPHDKNHPQVTLNFAHRLTKVELSIAAGEGVKAADLKGLKVEITKQRTQGSSDARYEAKTVVATSVATVTMNTNADGTKAQAILLPTTAADGINPIVPGREFLFTLASTGEVFRWAVPDVKMFEAGDRNIYNITINRTGVEVTASISDWNNGNGNGSDESAE